MLPVRKHLYENSIVIHDVLVNHNKLGVDVNIRGNLKKKSKLKKNQLSRVMFGTKQKNNTSPFLSYKERLTALTPEIDYDQAAMGLSASAVFFIAK
jgi:hypothetical protein